MTNLDLAASYLQKARTRLKILEVLLDDESFSDVIREAQEIVELATKGMLRRIGIDPPKWHDVGSIIVEHRQKFPEEMRADLDRVAEISKLLRRERELSFYGDIDFLPTEEYTRDEAEQAIEDAQFVTARAQQVIKPTSENQDGTAEEKP